MQDVVAGAVRAWSTRPGNRIFDLEGVSFGSLLRAALPPPVQQEVVAVAPWIHAPGDFSEYLAGRPRGFRTTLRKACRLLAEEGLEHRALHSPAPDGALETLRDLHSRAWGDASPFLPLFDRFADAARRGAARGEVVFHEMTDGHKAVASVVAFEVGGRVSLYQSGRIREPRWRNAATVLLAAIIDDASRRGLLEVDFLRGDEGYKRGFASEARQLVRLRAANGRMAGAVLKVLILRTTVRRSLGGIARRVRCQAAALSGLPIRPRRPADARGGLPPAADRG